MTNINDFITYIITEASLDDRIPSGVVDLTQLEHVQIVAEAMYNVCGDEQIVNEFLRSFLNEGKHPDRQAFNKEGWLVTFPSKEYRDAALKKGTHSIADPTHGKGGMNLYYKKKGKQKRQTQQATSAVQTQQAPTTPQTGQSSQQQTSSQPAGTSASGTQEPSGAATPAAAPSSTSTQEPDLTTTPAAPDAASKTSPTKSTQPSTSPSTPDAPKPSEIPAVDVPVVEKQPEQYASISKQFADKKGWSGEPYGEYRDRDGNSVAVVGLSGEIVPIKSVDRDEYKLFAQKLMS